jgi:C4-dicarboxylate-specific signal transduction histidine kinase
VQAIGRIGELLGEGLFDRAELDDKGELVNIERDVVSKTGERRTVLVHLKRVSIKDGTVLCTCRDITALKQTERELASTRLELTRAARLALAGELTASIVHEVRQPLMAILANASAGATLVQNSRSDPGLAELGDIFRDIQRDSSNAAKIIDRLQGLARKRPLELKPLDVNDVTMDVLQLVSADAYRRRVRICAELARSPLTVNGDRVSLQQVILNLIVNAMDAIDDGDGSEREVLVRTYRTADSVEVSVGDTGCGIGSDNLPRLFDPFFTTKTEGIGLGLAIARSIAEAHAGRIWAENDGSRGATFRLLLPAPSEAR